DRDFARRTVDLGADASALGAATANAAASPAQTNAGLPTQRYIKPPTWILGNRHRTGVPRHLRSYRGLEPRSGGLETAPDPSSGVRVQPALPLAGAIQTTRRADELQRRLSAPEWKLRREVRSPVPSRGEWRTPRRVV